MADIKERQRAMPIRILGRGAEGIARSPSSALVPTFLGEGSPSKIDYRKKGTLILTSLLEGLDLGDRCGPQTSVLCNQEEVAAERIRLGRLSHALDPDAPWAASKFPHNPWPSEKSQNMSAHFWSGVLLVTPKVTVAAFQPSW